MKKATILLLVAMLVSAAVTFVSTEARAERANCECWWATYNSDTDRCVYYFCLVPPDIWEIQDGDYSFWFREGGSGLFQEVELHPELICSCTSPCIAWWGDFLWEHDPRQLIEWYVWDNVNNLDTDWTQSNMPNCAAIPF